MSGRNIQNINIQPLDLTDLNVFGNIQIQDTTGNTLVLTNQGLVFNGSPDLLDYENTRLDTVEAVVGNVTSNVSTAVTRTRYQSTSGDTTFFTSPVQIQSELTCNKLVVNGSIDVLGSGRIWARNHVACARRTTTFNLSTNSSIANQLDSWADPTGMFSKSWVILGATVQGFRAPRNGIYEVTLVARFFDTSATIGIKPVLYPSGSILPNDQTIFIYRDSADRRAITYTQVLPMYASNVIDFLSFSGCSGQFCFMSLKYLGELA